jgi:hypothetical protein
MTKKQNELRLDTNENETISQDENEDKKVIAGVIKRLLDLEKHILSSTKEQTSGTERVKRIMDQIDRENF